MISIGLETGHIYCIRGDVARERIVRTKLQVDASPVTGLGFRVDGSALQLFVVTTSVSLFDMHNQPPRMHVLDQIGCEGNCVTMSDNQDVAKLDGFIKGEGEHRFDVVTVVKVCRAAGYHEHAMYVAKKAGKHEFIKGEGEHRFDVDTAVKVCRAAGYHEHAMYVVKKAGKHEWYLKILLEDLGSYDEALQYISSLESIQAAVTV